MSFRGPSLLILSTPLPHHACFAFSSPVSRVVSAYFYCQRAPHDQLCVAVVMDAAKVDLLTFAEHWGNYALRQFALASIKAEVRRVSQ